MQDQYINHIMNETGATVILRRRGSGNNEGSDGEGTFCSSVICTFDGHIISTLLIFYIYGFQLKSFSGCRWTAASASIFV